MAVPKFHCPLEFEGADPVLSELISARTTAARHLYQAECAVHDARAAVRGARDEVEASQCDHWLTAAYDHLHEANTRYAASDRAVRDHA